MTLGLTVRRTTDCATSEPRKLSLKLCLVACPGIEPGTYALSRQCSTTELAGPQIGAHMFGGDGWIRTNASFWEPDLQSGAFKPLCHIPTKLVPAVRFELTTLCLQSSSSGPLELSRQIDVQAFQQAGSQIPPGFCVGRACSHSGSKGSVSPPISPLLLWRLACLNCESLPSQTLVSKTPSLGALETRQIGLNQGCFTAVSIHLSSVGAIPLLPFLLPLSRGFIPGLRPFAVFQLPDFVPAAVSFRIARCSMLKGPKTKTPGCLRIPGVLFGNLSDEGSIASYPFPAECAWP